MKNIFFTIFFCIGALAANGQNQDWKIIGAPDSTSINILYVSSHGYIFGTETESGKMIVSKDDGKTWLEFYDQTNPYATIIFTEDASRIIYFSIQKDIYKVDPNSLVATKFVTVTDANVLEHLSFMDNGNLVVAAYKSLNLYSNTGVLLKKHTWMINGATILPGKGNQKNYVIISFGGPHFVLEFSDDLTYIGEKMSIPFNGLYDGNVVMRNDAIFFKRQFSIDGGITWTTIDQLKYDNIVNIHLGRDNKLYFQGIDSLYISADNGVNFENKINPGDATMIFADFDGSLVTYKNDCKKSSIYLSKNNGDTWQTQNIKIGGPICSIIAAGIDENTYTNDQCNSMRYRSNAISPWKKLEISTIESKWLGKVLPLSNGSILGIPDYGGVYTSFDQGDNWSLLSEKFNQSYQPFIEKGQKIFSFENDSLFYSNDFGKNWKSIFISNQDVTGFDFYSGFAITQNFNYFYFNFFHDNKLERYNFLTQENVPIELPSNLYYETLETAFNSENLYVIGGKSNDDKYYIAVSSDLGVTFNTYVIPGFEKYANLNIKTDHLNNIFVYSGKKVMMSADEGKTWIDITPNFTKLISINDLQVSYDNYIYLATTGMGILKYQTQLQEPSNTQDYLSKENLTIVPNPATHTIQVVSDIISNQWDDLTIFDMNGLVVSKLKVNVNNTLFDISHLVSGTYTIMLRTDRGTTHRSRFIKM